MGGPDYAPLDDALDGIAPYGIALDNGNSNHAPMVAEALCALGHPEAVMPWLGRYRARMRPRPASSATIGEDWRDALGRRERFADWAEFFHDELDQRPWPEVLDRWAARLAAGFCAAATHGPIRVGHAVRGLGERETPRRRRELADALAAWAATWQQLPGDPAANGALSPREAIEQIPVVAPERRRPGNIVAGLAVLADIPEFAPVIAMIDTRGAIAPKIAELTDVFARVYLANARNIPTTIAFIHAVTSTAAVGNMAPFAAEETARNLLRYAWQSGAALYACYGSGKAMPDDIAAIDGDRERLVERAIANGDEHVIKFTEACLDRDRQAPSPAYLAAADHVAAMIPARRPG